MTPKLSNEQRQAIEEQHGGPVLVVDGVTHEQYVLLPAEIYQRLRLFVEAEGFDIRETYPLQDNVAAEAGWDDPAMDDYNDYDAHRKSQ
jgi:hypothetical protein